MVVGQRTPPLQQQLDVLMTLLDHKEQKKRYIRDGQSIFERLPAEVRDRVAAMLHAAIEPLAGGGVYRSSGTTPYGLIARNTALAWQRRIWRVRSPNLHFFGVHVDSQAASTNLVNALCPP